MMRKLLKNIIAYTGFELRRRRQHVPGDHNAPVGSMEELLAGVKKRGLPCKNMLDIGANKAEWSFLFKTVYPNANCIMIEPLTDCEPEMAKFVQQYPGSKYVLCAAGSVNTESVITVWDDLYGSSLLPATDEQKLSKGNQRRITVRKMDDLLQENNIAVPEIVKIDVQGFELEALKGASSLFGKTELFILEVSLYEFDDVPGMPEFYDVIDFMYQRGYVVYEFPGFLRRPYDGALGQCDVAFVKKNGFLRKSNKWK